MSRVAYRAFGFWILVTIGLLRAAARKYRYPRPRGLQGEGTMENGDRCGDYFTMHPKFVCVCFVFVFVFVFSQNFCARALLGKSREASIFYAGGCRSSVSQSAGP